MRTKNLFKGHTLPLSLFKVKQAVTMLNADAYAVGGFVRDFFHYGSFQFQDIDIVVLDGRALEVAKEVSRLLDVPVIMYPKYGTAALKTKDGVELEFVSARKESYDRGSRKPNVKHGSLMDDLKRRDFTINCMCISLNEKSWGHLHDPLDGLTHINRRLLTTPTNPNITFSDDPLRMFRGVRFAANLGFRLSTQTKDAIRKNLHRLQGESVKVVSQERITQEVMKMLSRDTPSTGFRLMSETGLLDIFLPELSKLKGRESNGGVMHKDNFIHTLKVLDNVCQVSDNVWLRWVALLHDIGKYHCKRKHNGNGWSFHGHASYGANLIPGIFKRLKLPLGSEMKFVQKLTALHQRPSEWGLGQITDSSVRRLMADAGEDLSDLLLFCSCDITTKNKSLSDKYKNVLIVIWEKVEYLREQANIEKWTPPANGHVLMRELGLKPGRKLGTLLHEIKEAVLEGTIPYDQSSAIEYARSLL